jgi:hypothetical protein
VKIFSFSAMVFLSIVVRPQVVSAQEAADAITRWEHETGTYVTKAVKAQFPKYQASEYAKIRPTELGPHAAARGKTISALRDSRVKYLPYSTEVSEPQRGEWVIVDANGHPEKPAGSLDSFFSFDAVTAFLQKFATVHLDVEPVPPRDYKVNINGEDCDATDQKQAGWSKRRSQTVRVLQAILR